MSAAEPLRCSHCGEVIGVYEPLLVRANGEDRESSLAAEPELPLAGAEHLHRVCAQESPPAPGVVVRLDWQAPAAQPDEGPGSAARRPGRHRRAG